MAIVSSYILHYLLIIEVELAIFLTFFIISYEYFNYFTNCYIY